jgi:hypothetical protein
MLAFRTAGRWYPRTIKSQGVVTRLSRSLTCLRYAYDRVVRRGRVFGGIRDSQIVCNNLVMRSFVLTKALRQGGWERTYYTISFDADVHRISTYRTDLGPEDGLKCPALFVKPCFPLGCRGIWTDRRDRDAKWCSVSCMIQRIHNISAINPSCHLAVPSDFPRAKAHPQTAATSAALSIPPQPIGL